MSDMNRANQLLITSPEAPTTAATMLMNSDEHQLKKSNKFLDPYRHNNSEEAKVTHGSIGKWSSPANHKMVKSKIGGGADTNEGESPGRPSPIRLNLDQADSISIRVAPTEDSLLTNYENHD